MFRKCRELLSTYPERARSQESRIKMGRNQRVRAQQIGGEGGRKSGRGGGSMFSNKGGGRLRGWNDSGRPARKTENRIKLKQDMTKIKARNSRRGIKALEKNCVKWVGTSSWNHGQWAIAS